MNRKKGKIKPLIAATILLAAGVLTAGGIKAYLEDRDNNINTFTIGDVHIEATEPAFPTEDLDQDGVPDECELLIPYEEISKDPRIKNVGSNDAIVFFKVTAPVERLNLIGDDGKRKPIQDMDLFWFKQKEDAETAHESHWDEKWVELTTLDGEFVDCEGCNEEGKGYTYIFGYATRLTEHEETSPLFEKIQNKKYGSQTINGEETEQIQLEAYAIQADDIHHAGIEVDTSGKMTEEDLTYIYKVCILQNRQEGG